MGCLNTLSAREAALAIARGEITSQALVHDCLERIAARDADVQAWEHLDPKAALEQAKALDRAAKRGPLHGVPLGVKDVFETFDMPTRHGTPIYGGHRPRTDAATVASARHAAW